MKSARERARHADRGTAVPVGTDFSSEAAEAAGPRERAGESIVGYTTVQGSGSGPERAAAAQECGSGRCILLSFSKKKEQQRGQKTTGRRPQTERQMVPGSVPSPPLRGAHRPPSQGASGQAKARPQVSIHGPRTPRGAVLRGAGVRDLWAGRGAEASWGRREFIPVTPNAPRTPHYVPRKNPGRLSVQKYFNRNPWPFPGAKTSVRAR